VGLVVGEVKVVGAEVPGQAAEDLGG